MGEMAGKMLLSLLGPLLSRMVVVFLSVCLVRSLLFSSVYLVSVRGGAFGAFGVFRPVSLLVRLSVCSVRSRQRRPITDH